MLLRGARVLVTHPEPRALLSLMRPLIREGAHVDGASTGREAFMLCRRRPFDVVIVDLGLPDTSAAVLIRAIRAVNGPAGIVVATGAAGPALSILAHGIGADHLFSKPTDGRALVAYLGNRALSRAA